LFVLDAINSVTTYVVAGIFSYNINPANNYLYGCGSNNPNASYVF